MKLHDIEVKTITGETTPLSAYAGKTLLIVNTATGCGLAPQFAGLEELHRKYKDRGFAVLGFPCNQFAGQEPLSAEGIQETCRRKYDVTFPLFAKLDVNGPTAHPLYVHLKHTAPGLAGIEAIKWNFTKFLVDANGEVIERFAPTEKPEALAQKIEAAIEGKAKPVSAVPAVSTAATIARIVLGLALLFAGTAHLSFQRGEFLAQVPKWVPLDADFVVLASGVVELVLGAALIALGKRRVLIGAVVAAFFVAVFPGNLSQYMNGISAFGLDTDQARLIRLFFQPVLIAWALWSTGAWKAWRSRNAAA
ncbi:MAG: hypothetical protein QM817_07910 [Archangium sp.]